MIGTSDKAGPAGIPANPWRADGTLQPYSGESILVQAHDAQGRIAGTACLSPTTSPYRLAREFPQLFNGLPPPCCDTVWELSRFSAVDLSHGAAKASELLAEAFDAAAGRGAHKLIIEAPTALERLLARTGLRCYRAGPPMMIGGALIAACWAIVADL
jgi:acyl homoserine lactone synthase